MILDNTNKYLIGKNIGSLIQFLNQTHSESTKVIVKELAKQVSIGRALVGKELIQLFEMVEKYSSGPDFRDLMMNVSSNLMTVQRDKIFLDYDKVNPCPEFSKLLER
jgi:hypothetical protein